MSASVASVSGNRVTRLSVRIPRAGIWSATAELDSAVTADKLVGAAQVSVGPLTLSGTFDPALTGTYLERTECHVIGGAAGWRTQVKAKPYHDDGSGVKAATVLQHLANETGEAMGTITLPRTYLGADWVRRAGVATRALQLVVGATPWWVDYDGATQVGPRVTSEIVTTYEILKPDPGSKVVEVATDDPGGIVIGSILRGRLTPPLVVREITIEVGDGKIRMRCWGAPE